MELQRITKHLLVGCCFGTEASYHTTLEQAVQDACMDIRHLDGVGRVFKKCKTEKDLRSDLRIKEMYKHTEYPYEIVLRDGYMFYGEWCSERGTIKTLCNVMNETVHNKNGELCLIK